LFQKARQLATQFSRALDLKMKLFDWKKTSTWPEYWGKIFLDENDVLEDLVDKFSKDYTHIKVYHACRPVDIKTYYNNGLLIANYNCLSSEQLPSIFKSLGIQVPSEVLKREADKLGDLHNSYAFVVLDDRFILEYAGHYLIYGSEYLSAIVVGLQKEIVGLSKHDLKKIGIPTMFEIQMPIRYASYSDLCQLVRVVNNSIFEDELFYDLDFTFQLNQALKSEYFVGHYHPNKIRDPLYGYTSYHYKSKKANSVGNFAPVPLRSAATKSR
jgi:hypothetical protein